MVKNKVLKKEYRLPKWFWTIIAAIVIIVVILVGYLAVVRTGWPGYIQALSECEGKPPVEARVSILTGTSTYINPGDDKYRIPGVEGYRTYFCTEFEAREAGYEHLSHQI